MSNRTCKFFFLLILSSLSTRAAAGTVVELKNGFRALVVEKEHAPTTQLRFWVRAGSAHENPERTNVAHVIEHLMFSNYSPTELPYFTQAKTKGRVNANTRHFATVYTTQTTAEHLEFFIELEAKRMMAGPLIGKGGLTREVEIIKKEHLRTYSQLPYKLWRNFYEVGFPGHPLQWHTSGKAEHLAKITKADVLSYFKSYYRPDNSCLAVVSPVSEDKVATWIKAAFAKWQPTTPSPSATKKPWPKTGPFIKFSSKPGHAQAVLMGYRIPIDSGLAAHELDFLNHIFIRSQLNAVKSQLRFRARQGWEFGELNYDYDWHTIKAIVLTDQYQSANDWQKLLTAVAAHINNLSAEETNDLYQEYYLETQEAQLRSSAHADWLGRQCGKYGQERFEIKAHLADQKAFQKKVKSLLTPANMVLVAYGG